MVTCLTRTTIDQSLCRVQYFLDASKAFDKSKCLVLFKKFINSIVSLSSSGLQHLLNISSDYCERHDL